MTELYNCSMPMFVLYFFRNQGYRIFQDNWKFFSDIFSNSFIRNNLFVSRICLFQEFEISSFSQSLDDSRHLKEDGFY